MARFRRYGELLLGAGLIIGLDQLTKEWVRANLSLGESLTPIPAFASWLRIMHWNNTGAAFGLFPNGAIVFTVVGFIVIAAILYYYPLLPASHSLLRIALVLQLGGAGGNLISRLVHGTVTDFVAVGTFPLFNVSDSAISIGVGLLILSLWLEEREANREQASNISEGDIAGQGWEDIPG